MPDYLAIELADPLAPARFYENTFEMHSSWDPGGLDLREINYPANIDFGTFSRDCRSDRSANPLHFIERVAGPCPYGIDGLVMAHTEGPAVMSRFWMTALDPLTMRQWDDERLAVYIDGERRFDASLAELAEGRWPAGWGGERISGCLVSYVPFAFEHDMWIVLENTHAKLYYYQADVVRGELPDAAAAPVAGDFETTNLVPGSTIVYQASGKGAALALTLTAADTARDASRHAELKFAFDGVTSSVQAGDLCNASYAWADFDTGRVVTRVENGEVSCTVRWGWPHANEGTIAVSVTAPIRISVESVVLTEVPPGRFYAYTLTHESSDLSIEVAGLKGRGRLVAVMHSGEGETDDEFLTPDPLNWLESDEVFTIDGVTSVRGTGTEDFYNGGFYFNEGPYARPFGGVSWVGETEEGWGRAQMIRYFLGADQINFRKSFHATWEVNRVKHRFRYTPVFYVEP